MIIQISCDKPEGKMAETASATGYTGLTRLEPTLPSAYYYDPAHYERELKAIWNREWLYVCRADAVADPLAFRTFEIGAQKLLLVRGDDGVLRGFHNTCRHRGSILCQEPAGRLRSKIISCPYHQWSYTLKGELRRATSIALPDGFDPADYPLYDIAVAEWRGFVFVNLAGQDAPPFSSAFGREAAYLDHWPLEGLVVGHAATKAIACNWKIFWENFNECLHCPGIHPELSKMVPIYGRALMIEQDDPGFAARPATDDPKFKGGLRVGAETWSVNGLAHPNRFPDLTDAERRVGATFATSLPSVFIVAHVDYVRAVRVRPLGPELTELSAEWLFPPETLADPDFDLANVVDFALQVLAEDGAACEMNQAGLKSERHKHGVLMPEEYDVRQVQNWVRDRL
jgi:Rieske 2Fe-2S family protein